MWIDSRGSDILYRNECERLLTLAAGGTGHIGLIIDGVPAVFPVNYGMLGSDVILRLGEGVMLDTLRHSPIVAFQVDRGPDGQMNTWSVLVQGPANIMEDTTVLEGVKFGSPTAIVRQPGSTFIRIRTWSITGRRFTATTRVPARA